MKVSELKNKIAYLGAVKFKTRNLKFLGRLSIFTPIPLNAQDVWSLNQFPRREHGSVQHSHTNHFIPFLCNLDEKHSSKGLMKFCMFLSLYTTDYLIGLAFWAIPIGL